jgi:hypothetical protein
LRDTILDVCGKLEGESIVHTSIPVARDLWYLEEPLLSPTSPLAVSPNQSSPSLTVTAISTNSASQGPFNDWREPIRRGLISLDTETHYCIRSPPESNSGSPASISPTLSGGPQCYPLSQVSPPESALPSPMPLFAIPQKSLTEEHPRTTVTHLQPTVSYRNQAITLISICRTFVQEERSPESNAKLRLYGIMTLLFLCVL